MVLGKRWLFSIGNGAEIRPLEKVGKSPAHVYNLLFMTSHGKMLYSEIQIKLRAGQKVDNGKSKILKGPSMC